MAVFEDVGFTPENEDWIKYRLDDENILEIKLVVTRVVKYPEDRDELGMPKYLVKSHNIVRVRPRTPSD